MSRLREVAGAFGDVGVFLPLALALVAVNGLDPTVVFALAGLYYIVGGRFYGVPIPVQPFKAVSAIAIAQQLSPGAVHAAALWVGVGLLVLSLEPLPRVIERVFAPAVVRGIQLGLGLLLLTGALGLIGRDRRIPTMEFAGLALLIAGIVVVTLLQRQHRVPALFVVGAAGVLWGLVTLPATMPPLALGPVLAAPTLPTIPELATGLLVLALPQLPLTLGNSVVSTTDVAREYFGDGARRVQPVNLLRDMGAANLVAGFAGGIPMCHGAGGVTAHYRFGARSASAVYVAGGFYLALGLGFGAAAPAFLALFPTAVLGVLVAYVGWQHLLLVRRLERLDDWAVALLIGALTLVTGSLAVAFVIGLAVYWSWHAMSPACRLL